MTWTVTLSTRVAKGCKTLPKAVKKSLALLLTDIEDFGPVRGDWPNYSKLGHGRHHCHIKKGRPTYVAVWKENNGKVKLVEVTYVGTHEKAPY
ncbi:cytotoxic translational repressor of toxin-antitoxin stability system [Desulfomicrobium sp. ZS1]|uniref:cytotoxic translational repressor of toxin-antitoxin stability system n=1 Tax=Desulfomicrobium sp. ZS1 TaxID=2952228 RepID=UPI0020B3A8D2|nr:cytotoxic translational repressor of toxin-antitoxin stability system [Desulfomicrobium sp. ZS1]UTF50749.1 cytotoxic translational repressor of toxin-antitoxin stability system [Desulfomicrobium sp. ZS1]